MVSFSCENCGDVLTKKKLDAHRGQCRGASFTCLDCMVHFKGTDYKAHTSCISEAQKYQGSLYKEKPIKSRKSVAISDSASNVPRKAYVEDAPDVDIDVITIDSAPTQAPDPVQPVNVFDFLVDDETPNASRISLSGPKEQMQMVDHAPSVFEPGMQLASELEDDTTIHDNYSSDPEYPLIEPKTRQTPSSHAPKTPAQPITRSPIYELAAHSTSQKPTSQKRKRQIEDLDLSQARRSSQELDDEMTDAPPVLHSGLTGGLNRLLSNKSKFPPSPAYSGGDATSASTEPNPLSPVKVVRQIKHTKESKERGRTSSSALIKVRKTRRTSDESRPRKHHRPHHHSHHAADDSHHHSHTHAHAHVHAPSKRPLKALEYHSSHSSATHHPPSTTTTDPHNQLVLYRTRAELFLSFVTKGPESESGCSVNKALKRYHRERGEEGLGLGKVEEEKELWKALRLRRNSRGEVVVIF